MKTHCARLLLLMILIIVGFVTKAQIISTFDTDTEGWTALNAAAGEPIYISTGGNPGGFIQASDGISGVTTYMVAPSKFLGNRILSYQQFIRFDLKVALPSTTSGSGDVRIFGGGTSIVRNLDPPLPSTTVWTSYAIQIDETQSWRIGSPTGAIATKQQILQVLGSVTALQIGVEYSLITGTTDKGSLDNVILEQRTISPPPKISSFTPRKGQVGTTVTIEGSGFDAAISNNRVFFGNSAAIINAASATSISVTVPAGATFGPIRIINKSTGQSAISATEFTPTFTGGGRIIPSSFKARFTLDHAGGMGGLDLADIDDDGWMDIVVANQDNTGIRIYRNLANAGPLSAASFANPVFFPTSLSGTNGASLIIRDLDNDGKLDMVTSGWTGGPGAFATFRNTSTPGNLSFEAVERWNGASDESPPTAAEDIDGDGLIDLVSGEGSSPGTGWVIQNISTPGNIDFGYRQVLFSGGGISHQGATLADLDGDGKPEFIHKIQNALNQQNIHVNTSTPGTISFAPAITLPVGIQGNMVVHDFNKDGKKDLAWKSGFSNDDIYIRLNSNSGGPLSISDFSTQVILDSETGYYGGLSMADINGDGEPDLLATDSDKVAVFESNYSAGTFDEADFIKGHLFSGVGATTYPGTTQAADLNGDGKPELVYGTTNTSPAKIVIYENQNVAAPKISVNTVSPIQAPIGALVTITGSNFSPNINDNHVYFGGVRANVVTASATELTVNVPPGAGNDVVSARVGELSSSYHLPFHHTFSSGVTFDNTHFAPPVNFALANANYDIEVGDLDLDGKPDVIAEGASFITSIFLNTHGSGLISSASLTAAAVTSNSAGNAKLLDMDGDGRLDIVGVNGRAFPNLSTPGNILFGTEINVASTSNVDFADFNLDGKYDLAHANGSSAQLILQENRSTVGTFTDSGTFGTYSANFTISKPAAGGGIVSIDLDNDGFPDIAVTNPTTDNISIFPNAGRLRVNTTSFNPRIDIVVGDNPGRIYSGDFDSDGKVDLLVYHSTGTTTTLLSVFHNLSTPGNFSFNRIDLINPSATTVAHIADLDGDGKSEIITVSETGNRFSIFKNIHTGGALSAASFAAPFNTTVTAPRGLTTGDLNLDGKPEIIITRAAGLLVVYENLIANPAILSFTPSSGQAGTEVTINGTNFSGVAFENDVRFNNVRAWVKASNTTTLTVIVPPNATTGTIKVTVGSNLPATSTSDFTVTPFSCPPDPRTNGELDIAFNPLVQDPVTFTAVELQSTGKSIVAAPPVIIGGSNYEGILRFNSDGTLDNTFATTATYYPTKWQMVVMPNDKILVVEPGSQSYVRRLNADGTLDNAFNSPGYYASTIHSIGYQTDGKVLFSIYDDQQGNNFIYRLNTDGTLDNSFTSIAGLQANAIIQLSDGKILIGGGLVGGVKRLNASGTIDNSFAILDDMDGTVSDLALQSDNKIIAIGSFSEFDDVPVNNIVRLQQDGTVDLNFKTGRAFPFTVGLQLTTVKVLPNDKILIVGEYVSFNNVTRNRILLLNADGSLDCTFDAQAGPDAIITDAAIQTDGKILVTGGFTFYESTARNAFARVNYSSIAITITQQPVNPNNVCEGKNYVFSTDATGTTNITFQWQKFNAGSGQFEDLANSSTYSGVTTKNLTINNVSLAQSGDYRCKIQGDLASTVYCNIGTLTVNAKPADPVVTNAQRCGPGQVTLSATGGAAGEFIWRTSPTANDPIQNENNPSYTTPVVTSTTTYFVSVVNTFCESNRIAVTASILTIPSSPSVIPAASCGAGSVTLSASGGINGQYRWYDVPSGGSALIGEVNNFFITPVLTTSTSYYVSIANATCESPRTTVAATINNIPAKPSISSSEPINSGITAICLQPVTLRAPDGFNTYAWSSGQNTQEITILQPGNFSVVVTDANGCSSSASDFIQVISNTTCTNNPPVINTTSVQTFIGGKLTIDLSALISDPDNNLDPASLQVVNNTTQKGGATSLNGFILQIDYAAAKFSGKDLVTIRVCDLLNVCFEAAFEIDVIGDIKVYNGISPNGDSKNEKWEIEYITLFPDTQQNKVTIYNRWGDLVWEGENYDNDNVVFTGINKNGNELATGTYFYKIEFSGGRETMTGYLSLKR